MSSNIYIAFVKPVDPAALDDLLRGLGYLPQKKRKIRPQQVPRYSIMDGGKVIYFELEGGISDECREEWGNNHPTLVGDHGELIVANATLSTRLSFDPVSVDLTGRISSFDRSLKTEEDFYRLIQVEDWMWYHTGAQIQRVLGAIAEIDGDQLKPESDMYETGRGHHIDFLRKLSLIDRQYQ